MEPGSLTLPNFKELPEKYKCVKCHHPLRGPSQTACGHRICKPCLEELLMEDQPVKCPVGEEDCVEVTGRTVYPDICARREIAMLPVFCRNQKFGCCEFVCWRDLEEHTASCQFGRAEVKVMEAQVEDTKTEVKGMEGTSPTQPEGGSSLEDAQRLQVLKQQIRVFKEDFECERRDRERAQWRIQDLEQKLRMVHRMLSNEDDINALMSRSDKMEMKAEVKIMEKEVEDVTEVKGMERKLQTQPEGDSSLPEVLEQQIQVFKEDFECERRDRERAQCKIQDLEQELGKAHLQVHQMRCCQIMEEIEELQYQYDRDEYWRRRNVSLHGGDRTTSIQEKRRVTKRLSNTLADIIKDKVSTDLQFYRALQRIQDQEISFTELLDQDEGLNLLHQCLKHNRPSFLKVIHAVGAWQELTEQGAREYSEFSGRTPRQYAENKRLRRLIRQMDGLDQLEASMGGRKAALKFCRAGDLSGLKNAIGRGDRDVDPMDSDRNTALHWACISGNYDLVKYVVNELKVNPKSLNNRMESPLHVAINYGHTQLVDFLITTCHNDPRQIDINMNTPAQIAAENGDVQCLRQLHSSGVEVDPVLVVRAARSGSTNCVRYLLEKCKSDALIRDANGKTILMLAVEKGNLELVKYLVEKKDFNLRDVSSQNRNVLHYAADKGHTEITKYLLDRAREVGALGSILNQKDKHKISQLFALIQGLDKGRAAWHYVHLQRRYVSLYQKCTRNGRVDADFVGTIMKSGWGEEPEVGVLDSALEEYMGMNRTKDGEPDTTPMFLAAAKGHTGVALLLLKAGADVHIVDCFGETPMHMAAMRGHLDLAEELENAGSPLNSPDSDDFTPIRVARENEHPEMGDFLVIKRTKRFTDVLEDTITRQMLSSDRLSKIRAILKIMKERDALIKEIDYPSEHATVLSTSDGGVQEVPDIPNV